MAVISIHEYNFGGKVIKSDTDSKWKTYIVHNSQNPPVPTENCFSNLLQETKRTSRKRFPNDNDKPENLDILTISSLNDIDRTLYPGEENNINEVSKGMFGVSFETTRENFGHRTLTHMMLLPKDQLREFTDECLKDPRFCQGLTDKLLSGIESEFPKQEAESIMVITDKKIKTFDV